MMKKVHFTLIFCLLLLPWSGHGQTTLDTDGDTVKDDLDNCWDQVNPDQNDLDGDHVGDVCDIDRDGDGLTNAFEAAGKTATSPGRSDPGNWDTDGDHISDFYDCDPRDDMIGYGADCEQLILQKIKEPPPLSPSINDALGDDDQDGILNGVDNCPTVFNPGQQDQNNNGTGDQCDDLLLSASKLLPCTQGVTASFDAACSASGGGGDLKRGCALVVGQPQPASSVMDLVLLLMGPMALLSLLRALRKVHP